MKDESPSGPTGHFVRRILKNAGAMLGSELLTRGGMFAIYILVARRFGADHFAELSLGLAFFQSARTLASAGIQTLLTREVSKNRQEASALLSHGGFIVLCLGFLAQAVATASAYLLNYPQPVRYAILVVGLGTIPFALGVVCDSILQGLEKMRLIVFASGISNGLALGGILLVAFLDGPFAIILWIITASHLIALAVKLGALLTVGHASLVRPRWNVLASLFQRSLPFAGIRSLQAVLGSLVIVLVSKLVSESAAGLFNAAMQLMQPVALLIENTMIGALPVLSSSSHRTAFVVHQYKRILGALLALAIPGSVGLFLVSEAVLAFIYGENAFTEAAPVVRIVCWVLVLRVMTHVFGQHLVVNGREMSTVRILSIDTVVLAIAAPLLVWGLGLTGAGFSVLLLRAVDTFQHYWAVRTDYGWMEIVSAASLPAAASAVMAGALIIGFSDNFFFQVSLGVVCYFFTLATLLWMNGTLSAARSSS